MEMELEEEEQTMFEEVESQKGRPKTLMDRGDLIFKRLESKGAVFYQNVFSPLPIQQRRTNNNFIAINSDRQYKTYQIKDNELRFASHHTVDLPVFSKGYFRTFSENHLHYFFKKKNIEKRESAIKFFEENNLDWETASWIAFGLKIGVEQSETIYPDFLGESKYQEKDRKESKIRDIFDNQKPLLNLGICLFMGKDSKEAQESDPEERQVYYISRFDKKYHDFVNHLFRFKLKPEKLFGYRNKIVQDFEKISPKVSRLSTFYEHCQCFLIENSEPGLASKLMPFTQVDNYMITVGLVDLRKRIIPIKRLVSIYELFDAIEFKYAPSVNFVNIIMIDYAAELDVLMLDAWVSFYFNPDDRNNIQSVILNRNQAEAEQKLGFLSEMNDGRIKEIQKLRFKVWGLLKSRKTWIEVGVMGYQGNKLFQKAQGMIASFDERTSEITLSIYSNQAKALRARNEELKDGIDLERRSQKAVKEQDKVKKTVIHISKEGLFESRGIQADGIRLTQMINQDQLLMATSRNLLLIDINSKEIISCCQYSHNIPVFYKNTKIDSNIMVHLKLRFNLIEIFRISMEGAINEPSFEFLGILDFSNSVDNLFEIDRLVAFRKLEEEIYEMIVVAKMMESAEWAVVSKMLFLVQFQLRGPTEDQEEGKPEIIYMKSICIVDFSQEEIRTYNKSDLWNHIFFDGVETEAIQSDEEDKKTLVFRDLHRFQMTGYKIANLHMDQDLIFIQLTGEKDRLIKVIQALGDDQDGELTRAEVVRAQSFDLAAKIYFDDVTDLTRIFVLEKNEVAMRSQLSVLNEELDEIESFYFPWLDKIFGFKVISSVLLHIVGREQSSFERHKHGPEGDRDSPNMSMLLNLDKLKFHRLVVEGEGSLFPAPYDLGGGKLLAFTRDFKESQEKSSDGIYFSRCV